MYYIQFQAQEGAPWHGANPRNLDPFNCRTPLKSHAIGKAMRYAIENGTRHRVVLEDGTPVWDSDDDGDPRRVQVRHFNG